MNGEKARELMKEWANRLKVSDWKIALSDKCKPIEMSADGTYGCSVITEVLKAARIEIVDETMIPEYIEPFDWEQVLVHELLHLKLALLFENENRETTHDRLLHQMLNDLSVALVDAKRKKK